MALPSHACVGGAFQPVAPDSSSKCTFAPYGGSASSKRFKCCDARSPSIGGGKRSESLSEVWGRSTLPALALDGSPSAPMTESAGRHVRLSKASARSETIGCVPSANGYL